jgi:hypothetical protein
MSGLGSNTDSGAKIRVYYCRITIILYLAFIIRNLFLKNSVIKFENLALIIYFSSV